MALEQRLVDQLPSLGCFALIQRANNQVDQMESSWLFPDKTLADGSTPAAVATPCRWLLISPLDSARGTTENA
jgi:hypothetical protein